MVVVPLLVVPTLHQERMHFGVNSSLSSSSRSPRTPPEVEEVVGSDYMIPNPGGRLLSFYKVWLENGCHPRVVHILQWGYKIILRNPIKLSRHPTIHSGYTNRDKQKFLQDCVAQMLKKKQ